MLSMLYDNDAHVQHMLSQKAAAMYLQQHITLLATSPRMPVSV